MAVSIQLKGELLFIEFSDVFATADIVELIEKTAVFEQDATIVPDRIVDLSQLAGIEVTFRDILELAKQRQARKLPNRIKSALVASQPLHVGFARMYQTLMNNHPQIELGLFPTREEALVWLGRAKE